MTSLRFRIQCLIRLLFLLTRHYDFRYRWYTLSCSVRITILCQFHVQHASRFCANFGTISCQFHVQHASRFRTKLGTIVPVFVLGPESHFRPCPDLSKSDVTKAMVNHRSSCKCHLQPYKCFIQMTCNCGTPLIHISHVQNGYIKSGLLRQSFEFFFAFLDRVILGELLKNL